MSLLTPGSGLNGRINDYLLPANGAGPSTHSKCKLEPSKVSGGLLEHGPTPSV